MNGKKRGCGHPRFRSEYASLSIQNGTGRGTSSGDVVDDVTIEPVEAKDGLSLSVPQEHSFDGST